MSRRKIKNRGITNYDKTKEEKHITMNVRGILEVLRKQKQEREQDNVGKTQNEQQEESGIRDESGADGDQ